MQVFFIIFILCCRALGVSLPIQPTSAEEVFGKEEFTLVTNIYWGPIIWQELLMIRGHKVWMTVAGATSRHGGNANQNSLEITWNSISWTNTIDKRSVRCQALWEAVVWSGWVEKQILLQQSSAMLIEITSPAPPITQPGFKSYPIIYAPWGCGESLTSESQLYFPWCMVSAQIVLTWYLIPVHHCNVSDSGWGGGSSPQS